MKGSRFDRIGQPSRGSYSPSLPLFRSPCAVPPVTVTAEVPHLDPRYYARLAVGSCYFAWPYEPTPNKRISGAKDSKNAPVLRIAINAYQITTASRTHRQRPLRTTVRRLSYAVTQDFSRCRARQLSPCAPVTSPLPQQPSSGANVALSRYAPPSGLSPAFAKTRTPGHCLPCAVSWSPNICPYLFARISPVIIHE